MLCVLCLVVLCMCSFRMVYKLVVVVSRATAAIFVYSTQLSCTQHHYRCAGSNCVYSHCTTRLMRKRNTQTQHEHAGWTCCVAICFCFWKWIKRNKYGRNRGEIRVCLVIFLLYGNNTYEHSLVAGRCITHIFTLRESGPFFVVFACYFLNDFFLLRPPS